MLCWSAGFVTFGNTDFSEVSVKSYYLASFLSLLKQLAVYSVMKL